MLNHSARMMDILGYIIIIIITPLSQSLPFSSNRPKVSYSCPEECVQEFRKDTSHYYKNESSQEVCWHFLDLRHCLLHCGRYEYTDSVWLNSMEISCDKYFEKVDSSLECMRTYHLEIEDHCLQYMDSAVNTSKIMLSNQQSPLSFKSKICEYLRDHSRCLVSNMEFYCGADAVLLFSRQNMFKFFQSFIHDRTGKSIDQKLVSDCYLIPLNPPFLPAGLVNIASALALSAAQSDATDPQPLSAISEIEDQSSTFSISAVISISIGAVIIGIILIALITRYVITVLIIRNVL